MSYKFDFEFLADRWPDFVAGAWLTIQLTVLAIGFGFVVGTICAIAKASSAEPVIVVIEETAARRQGSRGMTRCKASMASAGCVTCTTPCIGLKFASKVPRAQASTGSQACDCLSTSFLGVSAR